MSLDDKMRAKIARAISRLEKNGTELREPFSKHLENGIFELRASFSSNTSRVLYFFFTGRAIILTNGFIKKTQKTPRSEIEKAKRYRIDYIERSIKKMATKFKDFLKEQMKNPNFRKEYEALELEDTIIQAFIDARKFSGLTQKQLSEKTGITQPDISKLERGNANPSIRTLKRLANGMGMKLKLEFLPA